MVVIGYKTFKCILILKDVFSHRRQKEISCIVGCSTLFNNLKFALLTTGILLPLFGAPKLGMILNVLVWKLRTLHVHASGYLTT